MYKYVCLLQAALYFFDFAEGLENDARQIDLSNSFIDKHDLSTMRQMTPADFSVLDIEGAVTEGAFGYEEYEWPCTSEMTAAYGYVLGQCSRGLTGESYIYNWCALSDDESIVYFHVTEYPGSNCTDNEIYNNTFWDYNNCDAVNSRRLFCTSSTQGWANYDFDQHIEIFNDHSCQGDMNYWKADNIDCLDFCYISSFSETVKGQCDKFPNDWSDDMCFHMTSRIDYKGVEYTYEELQMGKEPECTVPHTPTSRGVVISTSCGLTARVTDTHLMATPQGFQLAYSLKPGDVLFGGYSDEKMCEVVSVEKETTDQAYFGLNCVHSEVLSSGLRASTFGDFHALPSWYMTYVGGLIGTSATSQLGKYVAEWLYY